MSRTYNNKKRQEGLERKAAAEELKRQKEEEEKERELEIYWSIGAKKPGKKEMKEEADKLRQERKKKLQELYEKEMASL